MAGPAIERIADQPPNLLARLLQLNNAHAQETSELASSAFARMIVGSYLALTLQPPFSLMLCFDQDAAYDSPNFLWFKTRYPRFVYVDRVIVDERLRGRGAARALYELLFAQARADRHRFVVCEVNDDPPNPASHAFHQRMGFEPVGQAKLPNGKTVTYMARELPAPER
jgi:predicted GNAT superfamily acetyltransferase